MFLRKRLPPDLQGPYAAFAAQAERVESARTALLSCLPVGRVDPVPVSVGLDLVVDELRAVAAAVDDWRVDDAEDARTGGLPGHFPGRFPGHFHDHWRACRASLDEALEAVPEARAVAASSGELEELLDAVGDVVEPLDAWHAAERYWLSLRVRSRRRDSRSSTAR